MTPEKRGHKDTPSRSHAIADRMTIRQLIGGMNKADAHSTGVNMPSRNSDTS